MVDTNQCKMVYDGVEEEYEDFYDYSPALPEGNPFPLSPHTNRVPQSHLGILQHTHSVTE